MFSRSTSLSGNGKKSSTILTRPISPLVYLTVGFFIVVLVSSGRRGARPLNLAVMPALVAGIHVFLWPHPKGRMSGPSPATTKNLTKTPPVRQPPPDASMAQRGITMTLNSKFRRSTMLATAVALLAAFALTVSGASPAHADHCDDL